jgi:hypothetical protein
MAQMGTPVSSPGADVASLQAQINHQQVSVPSCALLRIASPRETALRPLAQPPALL